MAIDILGPLVKKKAKNCFVVLIKDRYSKLTRTTPMPRVTAPSVATVVLEH